MGSLKQSWELDDGMEDRNIYSSSLNCSASLREEMSGEQTRTLGTRRYKPDPVSSLREEFVCRAHRVEHRLDPVLTSMDALEKSH